MNDFVDLRKILTLDEVEWNLFRGFSPDDARGRIFGGQVIGQALVAAYKTVVPELLCHSLHCYFIRPGDPTIPVLYQVERARDGKSFATRRVAAIQRGEQVFNLAASFQVTEDGFDHQFSPPDAPTADSLADRTDAWIAKLPPDAQVWNRRRPMEMRAVGPSTPPGGVEKSGYSMWMRTKADLQGDQPFNQAVLAYMSDAGILEASMRPHDVNFHTPGMQCASLDHAMWFHRPVNPANWMLYVQDSPSAQGARGFTRGLIYAEDGALIASCAQEGLIRHRTP